MRIYTIVLPLISFAFAGMGRPARAATEDFFAIHVVDDQTARGVPLVELSLTNKARYYTDSNGYVAFNEPGLMDLDLWFGVRSWGYEGPQAALGMRGAVLKPTPGKEAELKVHRINIAERLYRLTGYGIYRDTVLLGKKPPIGGGLLSGMVMGQDTVETAIYRGKMRWFWGDTDRPGFPLGNFHTTGATSALPAEIDPDRGIAFDYFVDHPGGFVRSMISLKTKPPLPIWVDGLMVVSDRAGRERLLARYAVTKDLTVVESGLALYNDQEDRLEEYIALPREASAKLVPSGHPMRTNADGKEYYYFPAPYPIVRVENDFKHASDFASYEGFTCLKAAYSKKDSQLQRDGKGKLVWAWRRGAEPIGPGQVDEMVSAGLMQREESPFQMRSAETGKPLRVAGGSVAWSPYLGKWLMLFSQSLGESNLGEIWLAAANAPEGPWRDAIKVATHAMKNNNNDFYNPMQHAEFMRDDARMIYFEGTFVTTFSGNPAPTPLYDYNQLMYRVDLADGRLKFPEPPEGLSNAAPSKQGP